MDFANLDQILTLTVWRILLALGVLAIGIQIGWSLRKWHEKHPTLDHDRLPPPPKVPSFDRGFPSDDEDRYSSIPPKVE
ncbi:MAG: hypothetical protein PHC70_02680 [Patescibacteria group bacterium]|nr:hypothetical protein [Patescibacteria group bacterium]